MRKLEFGEMLAVIFILCMGVYAMYIHFGAHMASAALLMWGWVKEDPRFSRVMAHFFIAAIPIVMLMVIIQIIKFRMQQLSKND